MYMHARRQNTLQRACCCQTMRTYMGSLQHLPSWQKSSETSFRSSTFVAHAGWPSQ